jgi:OOP family OmpA-OmpF porin
MASCRAFRCRRRPAAYQNTSFDDVDQALAWQGILGIAWDFAPNWSLDLTGRYLQTDDLQWGSVTTNVGGPAVSAR